jgi:hypothetical protein
MVRLSGVGTSVVLKPKKLDFGNQPVGQRSQPQIVIVKNTGATDLTFASISSKGDFDQTNDCGSSIPAGGSCSINVTFDPSQQGTRAGTVVISDSDIGTSPQTIPLKGTGI